MYYLLGGAGYHNFGDELMVRGWLDRLSASGIQPDNIVVDGYSREKLSAAFGPAYDAVKYTDLVNGLAELGKIPKFCAPIMRGATFYESGVFEHYPKLQEDAALLTGASVIHIHGGGYLNKHFPRKGFLLGLAIATARLTGAKLVATGLGLTPLDLPKPELRDQVNDWFSTIKLIETRDEESAALLREIAPDASIVSGLDDTFVGEMSYEQDGKHRLHLSWNSPRMVEEEFRRVLEYTLANHQRYDEVVFWNCAGNDNGTWRVLSEQVPGIRRLTFTDLLSKPFPVAPRDHMLTARFHPHLIGARGGAVGGYYSHGSYYDVKHGSVCELGSGFFRIGRGELSYEAIAALQSTLYPRARALCSMKADLCDNIDELLNS